MNHDEYTDYSCSTPMERLARDVELVLRKWHLKGSDRHVSFAQQQHKQNQPQQHQQMPRNRANNNNHNSRSSDASTANSSQQHNNDQERKWGLQQQQQGSNKTTRSLMLNLNTEKETNHLMETTTSQSSNFLAKTQQRWSNVKLIRTHALDWTVPLAADGAKATLVLNLDLWDGPTDEHSSDLLPLSLRRLPQGAMPLDLFSDLSTTFGIGQHITLSLKKDQESTDTVVWALGGSLMQRHDSKLTPWIATATLSNILQTALQCAVSNISCNIPAFGIWGTYAPSSLNDKDGELNPFRDHAPLLPKWIQEWHTPKRRTSLFRSLGQVNCSYVPPILKSSMPLCETQFWMSVMPSRAITTSRLTAWGEILLQHSSTPTVVLCGAKHLYTWTKKTKPRTKNPNSLRSSRQLIHDWRDGAITTTTNVVDDVSLYQEQCRQHAVSLLERFSGASSSDPLWGPVDDPIHDVHAIVRWDPKPSTDGAGDLLLSMPLKIRSEQDMTEADWIEMEEAVECSILNPLQPSSFEIITVYDSETSLVNLTASLRLLLAALIRTTILPPTTMMHQLTDELEMDAFSNKHVDDVTETLVNRAGLGPVTRQLVKAIDWATLSDEMIEGWEAERVVDKLMNGALTLDFPDPPEQVFSDPDNAAPKDLFAPLPKSAPAGRLLSILFVHMSRLRSPASMALVWTYFVHDLQKRFYSRTSLPNMCYIGGIDSSPNMINTKQCFSTSGLRVKAENSAFVHCSEPQPDDMYCLIGQKLQVFNIGIESLVATEMYNATKVSRTFDRDESGKKNGGMIVDHLPVRPEKDKRFEKSIDERTNASNFYDATENGSNDGFSNDGDLFGGLDRQGARCPVLGVNLIQTGDQLYAPYLRRPIPWTDDVILERQNMLSKTAIGTTVSERLEIAHRFLMAKLLSDMQAFKAANPGAIFDDFTNWYGSPANPLEEFDRAAESEGWYFSRSDDISESSDTKRERAIGIIAATRDFWLDTWDKARPLPAIEQPALFDLSNTIEMVLDNLETIHPASLLNQIMAVNLSMAYFTLISTAGKCSRLASVTASFRMLREKIETALDLLARDVKHGTCNSEPVSLEHLPRHASLQSIQACEDACNAVSDSEALLSRATSLLDKFPDQYDFIERILTHRSNNGIPLESSEGRNAILGIIQQQQGHPEALPRPSRRSYILRNTDEETPCQMCIRYGEDGVFQDREGGLLIAMTKTVKKKTDEHS